MQSRSRCAGYLSVNKDAASTQVHAETLLIEKRKQCCKWLGYLQAIVVVDMFDYWLFTTYEQ
jgi:hypothetical protein